MPLLPKVLHHEKSLSSPISKHGSAALTMELQLESPPIILYGSPTESTGSIILGLLSLNIHPQVQTPGLDSDPPPFEEVELDAVTLLLVQSIRFTKPFHLPSASVGTCNDCCVRRNVLARWDVLTSRASFSMGAHAYPFSHLLPGSLPASCKLGLSHSHSYIKYDLVAVARRPHQADSIAKLPLNISRSILRGPDRNSSRVFPPTEVTATAVLPNVIYPKSSFPIELRLDNIVSLKGDRRWRMRKLTWKIEEHTKIRASACPKHASKLEATFVQRKSAYKRELKQGPSSSQGVPAPSAGGPSKSSGHHHSSIQTNMFVSTGPSSHTVDQHPEERDIEVQEPQENRPDELQQFVEDFLAPIPSAGLSLSAVASNSGPPPASPLQAVSSRATPDANGAHLAPEPAREEALYLDELRTVNHGEIKSGWKSDFSGRGKIEIVAEISVLNCLTGLTRHMNKRTSDEPKADDNVEGLRNGANVAGDVDDPNSGIFISHTLIVEVVVAEEVIQADRKPRLEPVKSASSTVSTDSGSGVQSQPQMGVPTGLARVLRMQFKVVMTERLGLGIAWDDEVPPMYEDVRTLSPPVYREASGSSTPLSGIVARQVLYGVGGLGRSTPRSIDGVSDGTGDLDERIGELTL